MITQVLKHLGSEQSIRIINKTYVSYLFTGIGLSWATQNENYIHYPLCIICPSIYIGYQSFNNIDNILKYTK